MLEVSDSSKARSVLLIDLHAGRGAAGRSSVDVFSSRFFFLILILKKIRSEKFMETAVIPINFL